MATGEPLPTTTAQALFLWALRAMGTAMSEQRVLQGFDLRTALAPVFGCLRARQQPGTTLCFAGLLAQATFRP